MSTSKSLSISSPAPSPIPPDLRNNIYSALLSGNGIRTIEATLEHELQASGWIADLKAYMTQLLRSGECTTVAEINARVLEKIQSGSDGGGRSRPGREDKGDESDSNESGSPEKERNGNGVTNGNGMNITNGNGSHATSDNLDLRIPERAVREAVRVVRRELDKTCEITVEEDK